MDPVDDKVIDGELDPFKSVDNKKIVVFRYV